MNNLNEESALLNFIGGKLHNFSSLHEIKKLVSGEGDEHKEKNQEMLPTSTNMLIMCLFLLLLLFRMILRVVTLSMRIYGLDMIFDVDNMLMKGKVLLLLLMTSRWDGRCYNVLAIPVDYTMESNVFKTYCSLMLFVNNYMKKKVKIIFVSLVTIGKVGNIMRVHGCVCCAGKRFI